MARGGADFDSERVKALLTLMESDRRNGTEKVTTKFRGKVDLIFTSLPKKKDCGAFTRHDLPILFTADEVQQFAMEQRLNKSQIKAVIQAVCARAKELGPVKHGGDRKSVRDDQDNNCNLDKTQGNDQTYLARSRPDLLNRIEAGELIVDDRRGEVGLTAREGREED